MATEITDLFCDFLDDYCSSKIWSEPQREYRHNIKLQLQESRPQISIWQRTGESVSLPEEGVPFFVYEMPLDYFAGLNVESSEWRSISTLLSDTDIYLRVHDSTGKCLMSNMVYLRSSSIVNSRTILVAIQMSMVQKNCSVTTPEKDLFMGVYYDSDVENDIVISNYTVSSLNLTTLLQDASTATFRFLNGFLVKSITESMLVTGDLVELIHDNNIIASFQIDLTVDAQTRNYISTDGQSKYIIHIPKELNPTNLIIPHDTCDFFIFPRNLTNKDRIGRFIHRCQGSESLSFIQITHNDFGVPIALIDQFRAYTGSNEVVLYAFIRKHSRTKTLVRDRNYTDFLYQLTDTQILDYLEGQGTAEMDFWKASNLEVSNFTRIMKDTSSQSLSNTLDFYTEALGYVNTAALLSGRIYRYTGTISSDESFVKRVVMPIAYQWKTCPSCGEANSILSDTCSNCSAELKTNVLTAIVTLNGKKIPFSQVSTKMVSVISGEVSNSIQMEVTVTGVSSLNVQEENELIIEVIEESDFDSYLVSPTSEVHEFWFKTGDYHIYSLSTLSSAVKIPGGQFETRYNSEDLTSFDITQVGELSKILFTPSQYGKQYLIQSQLGSYRQSVDIQSMLLSNSNIVYTPMDSAQVISPSSYTPIADSSSITFAACDGIEVYESTADGYVAVGTEEGVAINELPERQKQVTFSESNYSKTFLILRFDLNEVPVMEERNLQFYLNGRMLVEKVDFWDVSPATYLPHVFTLHNISYLNESANSLEICSSSADSVYYQTDFISSNFINSKQDPVIYYPSFSEVYTDGNQLCSISSTNGRLSDLNPTVVPTRKGALYLVKTDLPITIRNAMNEGYLTADLIRFNKVMYLFSRQTTDDPAIYTMPYSHRIASIYLNTIIDDILDGRLVMVDETDITRVMTYLTAYDYLLPFDLPLAFTQTPELDINGNPTGRTIKTSVINRDYVDVFPSYTQRLISGSSLYATILKLIDYIVPTDTVVDEVGVDTTVNNS